MKKQTLSVMALMTLMLASATFVGCKNYDSDIDQLKTDVAENKTAIKALQDAMSKGLMVSKVEAVADGYKLTMSDNSTLMLNHGKDGAKGIAGPQGEQGDPAVAPQMRVNKARNWEMSIDGGKTWAEIKDADGNAIADAKTFVKDNITVNAEGNIVISDKITGYKVDITIPTIILVPEQFYMTVSAVDASGVMKTSKVPTLGYFDNLSVTSITPLVAADKVFTIYKTKLVAEATIGGVKYASNDMIYNSNGVNVILNPSNIDAENIKFQFVAALEGGELYDMPVKLKATPSKAKVSTITTKSAATAVWTIGLDGDKAVGDLLLGNASALALSAENSYGKGVRTMSSYDFSIVINTTGAAVGTIVDKTSAHTTEGAVVIAPANVMASALRIAKADEGKIALYKEDGTAVNTKADEYEAYSGNYIIRQTAPAPKAAVADVEYILKYSSIGTDGIVKADQTVTASFVASTTVNSEYTLDKPFKADGKDAAVEYKLTKAELLEVMFPGNSVAKADFKANANNFAVVANEAATKAKVTFAFYLSNTEVVDAVLLDESKFDEVRISVDQANFLPGVKVLDYALAFEYRKNGSTPKAPFTFKLKIDGASPALTSKIAPASQLKIPNTGIGTTVALADVRLCTDLGVSTEITTTGAVVSITSLENVPKTGVNTSVILTKTGTEQAPVYTLTRNGAAPAADEDVIIKLKGKDKWGKEFTTSEYVLVMEAR